MTTTVTCFGPAGARVAIHSDQAVVTSSLGHLFAPWWNPKNLREGAEPAAHVTVRVDRQIQEAGRSLLRDPNLREGRYAYQRLLFTTGQGAVRAYCPHDAVAYEAVGNHVTVTGLTRTSVILAASRVVVDLVWGLMEAQGYTLVRASSATSGARAVLTLDGPGSGMSTSALLLAAEHHYGLQATEAVFARVESDGSISTRAWANPISIGLQQLYALGWSETVCALAEREGVLHPSTDPRVIDALKAGRGTALLDADGAELTVRLWPRAADQFGVFTTHTMRRRGRRGAHRRTRGGLRGRRAADGERQRRAAGRHGRRRSAGPAPAVSRPPHHRRPPGPRAGGAAAPLRRPHRRHPSIHPRGGHPRRRLLTPHHPWTPQAPAARS